MAGRLRPDHLARLMGWAHGQHEAHTADYVGAVNWDLVIPSLVTLAGLVMFVLGDNYRYPKEIMFDVGALLIFGGIIVGLAGMIVLGLALLRREKPGDPFAAYRDEKLIAFLVPDSPPRAWSISDVRDLHATLLGHGPAQTLEVCLTLADGTTEVVEFPREGALRGMRWWVKKTRAVLDDSAD